jgi:ubiquinone/menaquinone biosynthesis C-methylase UbiE
MDTQGFVVPQEVVKNLAPQQGDRIVDMGAGSGAYTFACAQYVGETGRIYAIDVQKDLLTKIINESQRQNIQNIDTLWADIESPNSTRFNDATIDIVILSNTLFQLPDKSAPLIEAARIIKPGGRVVVIDWSESFGHMGPHPEDVLTADAAKKLIETSGLVATQRFTPGAHHYGFVCHKHI